MRRRRNPGAGPAPDRGACQMALADRQADQAAHVGRADHQGRQGPVAGQEHPAAWADVQATAGRRGRLGQAGRRDERRGRQDREDRRDLEGRRGCREGPQVRQVRLDPWVAVRAWDHPGHRPMAHQGDYQAK